MDLPKVSRQFPPRDTPVGTGEDLSIDRRGQEKTGVCRVGREIPHRPVGHRRQWKRFPGPASIRRTMDGPLSAKGAFSIPHEDHLGGVWLHHRAPTVGEGELFANPQGLPCHAIVDRGKDFAWRDDAYLLLWPSADGQVVNVRIFHPARDRLPGLTTIRTPSDAIDLDACPESADGPSGQ